MLSHSLRRDARILDRAVDKALTRLRSGREKHLNRRTQIERELSLLVTKMDRLMDALAEGLEHLPVGNEGTYSREDIYLDHN